MRIIAGKARRLPLKTAPGLDTRPTSDRIKETLFNILSPQLADSCVLLQRDVVSAIRRMEGEEAFDLVFLDPPYGKGLEEEALKALAGSGLITKETLVILEARLDFPLAFIFTAKIRELL